MNSGQALWGYGADTILGAASGGGVVVSKGQSVFQLDSNGIATDEGIAGSLIGLDWFGELYDTGGLFDTTIEWATSFWATPAGGPSPNNGATDMPWYPPLPSCSSAKVPCSGEAMWNAFKALKTLVASPCSLCDSFMFNKIGYTRDKFTMLVNKPALLSDGTRSGARATTALCGHALAMFGCPAGPLQTVADYMQAHGNPVAVSQTPSPKGLVIFFNPGSICTAGTSPGGFLNEATIFHEALHGLTGLGDSDLENKLGIPTTDVNSFGSASISYYIETNILGANLHYSDGGGNPALVCKEQ